MLIGYARVSTKEQTLDMQTDALLRVGVPPDDIYTDKISGTKAKRPGLDFALKRLREGDTLIVWKLDRLGRSMTHLLQMVRDIHEIGAGFKSLTEQIDVNAGPMGKLVFHIFCALAQFESDVTRERTNTGMAAAKARGRVGGRRHYLDAEKIACLKRRLVETDDDLNEVAAAFGIKRRTINNYITGGREALRQRIADGLETLS